MRYRQNTKGDILYGPLVISVKNDQFYIIVRPFNILIVIYLKIYCIIHTLCIFVPTTKARFSKSEVEKS